MKELVSTGADFLCDGGRSAVGVFDENRICRAERAIHDEVFRQRGAQVPITVPYFTISVETLPVNQAKVVPTSMATQAKTASALVSNVRLVFVAFAIFYGLLFDFADATFSIYSVMSAKRRCQECSVFFASVELVELTKRKRGSPPPIRILLIVQFS